MKQVKAEKRHDTIQRFCVRNRVEHIALMVTFVVLAATGIAQRYYDSNLSTWLILNLGGIDGTRLIHRVFGVVLTLGLVYHFGFLNYALFIRRGKLSMMPTLEDFRHIVDDLKHGLGFSKERPRFDRYDYRQKFEYVGLIFGSFILVVSGFILLFPVLVTRILPGQVVAAALVFHGYEATLAIITIAVWHLYDVVFRPGIFPADTSIFTGRISRRRMIEEHPREYARITGEGKSENTAAEA